MFCGVRRSSEVAVSDLCFEKGVSAVVGDLLEIEAVVVVVTESARACSYDFSKEVPKIVEFWLLPV